MAQKLWLVEIYNRRLDERERRKAFVLERGLLNVRKQQAADRRRSAAERELQVWCLVSGMVNGLQRGTADSGFCFRALLRGFGAGGCQLQFGCPSR